MDSYWSRKTLSRRAALRSAALTGGGIAALSLVGCGGDDDDAATGGTSSGAQSSGTKTDAVVDIRKGNTGGKLVFQAYADWGGTVLVKTANQGIHQGASLTHSSLYQMRAGRPGVDRTTNEIELDIATAMPEQLPDQVTYIAKMRTDAKFQNGRAVTSEDVRYSYDRYAFAADSAYKSQWPFLEKVEAVDATTIRFTTKGPFSDFNGALANYISGHILLKEFEESPDAINKTMGSGPFLMVDRQAPVLNGRYRRNPDFYDKPWPYFDEIEVLGTSDTAKKIADFSSKQTHVTYWLFEEDADLVKKNRPDAVHFVNTFPGYSSRPRVDLPPFNDKRVRQAMSMAIDRKQMNEATQKGRAEEDQAMSWTNKNLGFRKPAEFPAELYKYWKLDVQTAKQLMAAAGHNAPLDIPLIHWDPTVIGQGVVDQAVLVGTNWRNSGLFNPKFEQRTFPQTAGTTTVGNYEGVYYGPGGGNGAFSFYPGLAMRNFLWSPPEGVKSPTPNAQHINDQRIAALVDKQYSQLNKEERKQTFRQIEEIMAEEQFLQVTVTVNNNFFTDPILRNAQTPYWMTNGNIHFLKYWWFDKS